MVPPYRKWSRFENSPSFSEVVHFGSNLAPLQENGTTVELFWLHCGAVFNLFLVENGTTLPFRLHFFLSVMTYHHAKFRWEPYRNGKKNNVPHEMFWTAAQYVYDCP